MTAALYASNGFRFLGIPACASEVLVESAAQKCRNLYKLDFALGVKSCVQIGYDAHIRLMDDDVKECLSRLQEPRHRLLYEVFWPHVADESVPTLASHRSLVAPAVVQHLTNIVQQDNGQDGLLALHALAIASHNQAIAHELAFGTGAAAWTEALWVQALTYWSQIIAMDAFWAYLGQRVSTWDDPRVRPEDVEQVRTHLPGVLLGFHALFALAYDRVGELTACDKHLDLLHTSAFPAASATVLDATTRLLTDRRIKPLIQQAETELLAPPAKVSRQHFTKSCTALMAGASAVCDSLLHDLHLPAALVLRMQFDGLCDCILKAIHHKLNYDAEGRLRNVLSGSLIIKKMLTLPLSSSMRATLERTLRSDTKLLYKDFLASPHEVDPTVCWFLDGEDADPEASLELPVYKITRREVQVQYHTGTSSIAVGYNAQHILVPRSVKAKASHQGHPRIPAEALAAQQQVLQHLTQENTAQMAQERAQRDAAIADERKDCRQRQQVYQQHCAAATSAAQWQLATARAAQAQAVQQVEAQYAAALQQHTQEQDAQLAAPQALLARMHSLRGWCMLELPLLLGTGALLASGRDALPLPAPTRLVAIGVLSCVSALILGAAMRGVQRWQGRRCIERITQHSSTQAQQLKQESLRAQAALERHGLEATEPARQTLARIEEYCKQLERQSASRIAHLEDTCRDSIARSTRHTQQQMATLQEQFHQQYAARPEATAAEFPIYVHAKAASYQNGVEPSASEREMTSAEKNEARLRFQASASSRRTSGRG